MAQPPQDAIKLTTSGDSCSAVNSRQGFRNIQRIRGAVVNISETEAVAVTCPMTTATHGTVNYTDRFFASINLHNHGLFEADYSCVLRQMDAGNNTVASYKEEIHLSPGENGNSYDSISFSVFRLAAEGGAFRLNLTCVLPPQSSLSAIEMVTPLLDSDFSF
jgi:hypothetical protein